MVITLIFDYAGGTYVSQVQVRTIDELPNKLVDAIDWKSVSPRPSKSVLSKFIRSVSDSAPSELDGLRQVWCMSGILRGKVAIIHAINTKL